MGNIMNCKKLNAIFIVMVLTASTIGNINNQTDWLQWRGPNRTGISTETGLLKAWPEKGPKVVWTISDLGAGYGSMAIKDNSLLVQGTKGSESVVYCLDRTSGKTLWTRALGSSLREGRGDGPRATPTIDGDKVYALSENGDLACLQFKDGNVVWQRNILKDFDGRNPKWLISESPLVDGNNLIVTPGGSEAGIVALDKNTGKTVWTTKELSDQAAYSSCVAVNVQGVRTILGFTSGAAVGLRANDGKLMWRYSRVANRVANITTPIFHDNKVFYTSAYDTGAALLGLQAQGREVKAEEIYFTRDMMNHHGGVVLVNGYLYGFSNQILTCLEFATGKVMWKDRSVGKGAVTYADGHLYLLGENNIVGLAEATPSGYKEKGRFEISDQGKPSWAHPVVSSGKLFVRNQGVLTCYDIKTNAGV
jgi:outer membrane protein assembly factor BamB